MTLPCASADDPLARLGGVTKSEGLPVRAWRSLRDDGLGSTWCRVLDTLGYRRLYVMRRCLHEPIPDCPARLPLSIDWLTSEGVESYRSFRAGNDAAALLLAEGDRCLLARHQGRIVGALWGSTRRARSGRLDRDLPLAAGEAFQFNTYTSAAERGQGVASALSAAWLRQLRAEGYGAGLTLVLPENRAALKAYTKAGYRISSIVRSLHLGPWRYHWPPAGLSDVC